MDLVVRGVAVAIAFVGTPSRRIVGIERIGSNSSGGPVDTAGWRGVQGLRAASPLPPTWPGRSILRPGLPSHLAYPLTRGPVGK